MTFRRHIVVLLVALFGLLGPSLAAGAGAVMASVAPVATAADAETGVIVPASYKPCEMQGGKRVMPCPPDFGVLMQPVAASYRPPDTAAPLGAGPNLGRPRPEAEPRPPRGRA